MKLISDVRVQGVIDAYPEHVQHRLLQLRKLIIESAEELELPQLEETLKWGEPSYLAKHGSTVRFDYKAKEPDQYALYFKCTSKLVPTFKKIYKNQLSFSGDRAIIIKLTEEVPTQQLKHCIQLALNYHKLKHLPLLGA